ncbi:pyridoxal-phosphate-dependent aminotransferase family protein [Pendulispora albinea]|uniref:Aminotransferase class V-fold PLP-dependent enzyme n=1 Tax=Pendulispora albinea TaxID=2741071 RepID=A0ABZ2LKU7_9BACT
MSERPLLMIPGPIEISDAVRQAASGPPPGHLAPSLIAAFGLALRRMRHVWLSGASSQPLVVSGSGTLAMEIAVLNTMQPGDRALVLHTGYFSARMADMLARRSVNVDVVRAPFGQAPETSEVESAIARAKEEKRPFKALFVTHVDTSTGVLADARALCGVARANGLLSIVDGVCATGAERFEMEAWGADVYLTASQKAIGLPPGLALLVFSERALQARARLEVAPPLSADLDAWLPIMRAYEAGQPSYFATPATPLIAALAVGLGEILGAEGAAEPAGAEAAERAMNARFALHERAAKAMRAAWAALGLALVPARESITAHTLSAIQYPAGVDVSAVARITAQGVIVAGGLDPENKAKYFRVGHMGYSATQPAHLLRTIRAVTLGLGRSEDEARTAQRAAESLL